MTPDEKRRAIAKAHGATPEEVEELARWMAEVIDDEDLVLPRTLAAATCFCGYSEEVCRFRLCEAKIARKETDS